jgi:hypothetical protein
VHFTPPGYQDVHDAKLGPCFLCAQPRLASGVPRLLAGAAWAVAADCLSVLGLGIL